MLTRRTVLSAAAAALTVAPVARALAQGGYASRPIKFFCGFPPGGVADIVARVITPQLGTRLGQPVIVDNRSGVGGVIGVDAVAKAAPDGYTMGFGVSGALTSSVTLMKLPYDPTKDIAPVSTVVLNPLTLCVSASSPIRTLTEFIAAAKAHPKKFSYGTAGPGTAMNLAGELLKDMAGFDMEHVPYKGSSPAATDLLGGHLTAAVLDWATAKPQVEAGRLRALAQTGARRSGVVPDVPTAAEAGVPGYEFNSWFGLVMPARTPAAIVDRVHTELVAILNDGTVRKQLQDVGTDPWPSTPAEMAARIQHEIALTARLIRQAGIKTNT